MDIKDRNKIIELLRSWLSQAKQIPQSLKTIAPLPPPTLKTLDQLMEAMVPKGIESPAEGTSTRIAADTNLQAGGDPLLENPNAENDHEGQEMKLREEPREEPQQSKESRDELRTFKQQNCPKEEECDKEEGSERTDRLLPLQQRSSENNQPLAEDEAETTRQTDLPD